MWVCRLPVHIDPARRIDFYGNLRVYLKTPNAPGQRAFLRCAASFFLEIRQYSCEKMSCATQKSLAAGHIMSFQIHPRRIRNFAIGRQSRRPLQKSFRCPALCRGGRLCPPADCTVFYGNLQQIRSFSTGRCGHRPLQGAVQIPSPSHFQYPHPLRIGDSLLCALPVGQKTVF